MNALLEQREIWFVDGPWSGQKAICDPSTSFIEVPAIIDRELRRAFYSEIRPNEFTFMGLSVSEVVM